LIEPKLLWYLLPGLILLFGAIAILYKMEQIKGSFYTRQRNKRMEEHKERIRQSFESSNRLPPRPQMETIFGDSFHTFLDEFYLEKSKEIAQKKKEVKDHMAMMRRKKEEKKRKKLEEEQKKKDYQKHKTSRLAKAAQMLDEKEGEQKRRKKNA